MNDYNPFKWTSGEDDEEEDDDHEEIQWADLAGTDSDRDDLTF